MKLNGTLQGWTAALVVVVSGGFYFCRVAYRVGQIEQKVDRMQKDLDWLRDKLVEHFERSEA